MRRAIWLIPWLMIGCVDGESPTEPVQHPTLAETTTESTTTIACWIETPDDAPWVLTCETGNEP